jgi:imidazole glycerol-phosphate synthase subunit HisH
LIGVLDYGVGNVSAFLRAFYLNDVPAKAVSSPDDYESVSKLILPGVGAFDSAMGKLNNSGLRNKLDYLVMEENTPLLGVCIGMHMLGRASAEGNLDGLGYISGVTEKLQRKTNNEVMVLPHMGWNDVSVPREDDIWEGINLKEGFYFLHSYAFLPDQSNSTIGYSVYSESFACAIRSSNVYGFQFHPEKSLSNGIKLLTNFAKL